LTQGRIIGGSGLRATSQTTSRTSMQAWITHGLEALQEITHRRPCRRRRICAPCPSTATVRGRWVRGPSARTTRLAPRARTSGVRVCQWSSRRRSETEPHQPNRGKVDFRRRPENPNVRIKNWLLASQISVLPVQQPRQCEVVGCVVRQREQRA